MHALNWLNGSFIAENSAYPKNGPVSLLQMIALDGFLHGKDVCVVKLKSIAPASLLNSNSSGDDH